MSPTCFVSYAWESESHKDWVRNLATKLQENEIHTRLDQWDLGPGLDMLRYMESSVRESDRVVLICTPTFAEKANQGTGGVGYEKAVVSAELFYSAKDTAKFIPILRSGEPGVALPSYIQSRIFIDFRDRTRFDSSLKELVNAIKEVKIYKRPPLGSPPTTANDAQAPPLLKSVPSHKEFEVVFRFAQSLSGINLTNREAADWTEAFLREHGPEQFDLFKSVLQFAYSLNGLNFPTRKEAATFALTWLTQYSHCSFDEFKKRFAFAYGLSGMNLQRAEALEWALRQMGTPT